MLTNRLPSSNVINIWGNKESMNLNSMILTNIQVSSYFKKELYELKTYHEVIDEIYYRVKHLEPWEKGRRTQGLHGMCGGVRGVGSGGIVSTAFCILYKLYTLKLTRKQVIGLINHQDSPYIRGLGLMYVRYTQQPQDLYAWFEPYLDDPEEIDVRAGGGCVMTIGAMLRQWLTRLEWYDTLFPRIPVQIQSEIMARLKCAYGDAVEAPAAKKMPQRVDDAAQRSRSRSKSLSKGRKSRSRSKSDDEKSRSRHHKKHHRKGSRYRSRTRSKSRSPLRPRSYDRHKDRDRKKHKSHKHHHKQRDGADDHKQHDRSRSRSKASHEKKKIRDSS